MRADLERELLYLFKLGDVLQKRVAETKAPALVFQEADLSVRVVRDIYSADFDRAIVDDPKQHHRLLSFFSRTAPELVEHVELWEEPVPLFEAFGVENVLKSTLSRRVDLPSGGYLVIDYAEALTVIDVNSGSFIGRGKGARLEDTITKTDLEAADEVVKQLRLRDIGGIIVIDFIDMARARNRDAVLKTLKKSLDEDRTKTFVVEISPLGLVDDAAERDRGGRGDHDPALPDVRRRGRNQIRGDDPIEFERRMRDLAKETSAEALLIQINPRVSAEFTGNDARVLHQIEDETGKWFHFEGSRACRWSTLPSCRRARVKPFWSAHCRSARARRSTLRSSSRTCTAPATRSPRSTATSSPCAAARGTWARSTSSGSRRLGGRPRSPRWSMSASPDGAAADEPGMA